jgi:hypothetical protein
MVGLFFVAYTLMYQFFRFIFFMESAGMMACRAAPWLYKDVQVVGDLHRVSSSRTTGSTSLTGVGWM